MEPKKIYKEKITCRLCGSELEIVLDLGDIYLNNFVEEGQEIVSAPLTLVKCKHCELVQLKHTPDLDLLYKQYWYLSSLNKSMIEALQDIVEDVEARADLQPKDVVIDIGCNDGTMLSQYSVSDLYKIGFDPALNLAKKAKRHCTSFYNTYFGDISIETPKAKVITSIAMFYDLEDPHTFVELIKRSLTRDGIWIVQFTDLLSMFKINAFDNICHEHLEYYSFKVLRNLFEQHNLEVFDVSTNSVNGGSIRMYIGWKNQRHISPAVDELEKEERNYMNSFDDPFVAFAGKVRDIKEKIMCFLNEVEAQNKTVFAMGASTKGNTLLQYLGITNKQIPYAAEVNKEKFGKKTVGTNISIISESSALSLNPDYFLVLPWHFIDTLLKIHEPYLKKGGKFVVPMPNPVIYEYKDDMLYSIPL
jgi:hypothetical protein